MIIDKLGKIFEDRRKTDRRKEEIEVDNERRKVERRKTKKVGKK